MVRTDQVGDTYKYVRIVTPLPAVWLLVSILVVAVIRGKFYDSISDYYGGPLRDVFVGALLASAVGMIAYKGRSKLEDYALNFAGLNAIFVALVPNTFQALVNDTRAAEAASLPVTVSSAELLENLRVSVGTLLVIVAIFIAADLALMHWARFRTKDQTGLINALIVVSFCLEVVLLLIVVALVFDLDSIGPLSIFSIVHFASATLLMINLSFAAASYAFPKRLRNRQDADAPDDAVQWLFVAITVTMWLGFAVGVILIATDVPYAILGVEVFEIVLFLVFWYVATSSEWITAWRAQRKASTPGAE